MKDRDSIEIRRVPEQARSKSTMDQIHKAACDLFSQRGIQVVTMTEIADSAGVTKPALYRYFPNKRALMYDIAQRVFTTNRRTLEADLIEGDEALPVRMKRNIKIYCDLHIKEPFRLLLQASIAADPDISALEFEESRVNAGILADALQALCPDGDRDRLFRRAFLLLELMDGLIRVVVSGNVDDPEAYISDFVDCFTSDLVSE